MNRRKTASVKQKPFALWAVEFRSRNKAEGLRTYLIRKAGTPVLFRLRAQALQFVDAEYGYLRGRDYLRKEPYGWLLPRPVRVKIIYNTKG